MSTRDERRRARKMGYAIANHWLKGARDIKNRVYVGVLLIDLKPGIEYPPGVRRTCQACKGMMDIDARLQRLADKAQAIVCTRCAAKAKHSTVESIVMDSLNYDNGGEL